MLIDMFHIQMQLMQRLDQWDEYVCIYVCMYVHMCVRACACVHVRVCMYVCIYVFMYVRMYVCMYVLMSIQLIRFFYGVEEELMGNFSELV